MFTNWKKNSAKTAAVGVLAMGLAGGMAFQEAAPAEALIFLAPLAPVIGGAVGGTGITAGGWALLAGGAAAVGSALHFSTPDENGDTGIDRAIDWLMQPVDIFGREINEDGTEKSVAKPIPKDPEVQIYDPSLCSHTACPKHPWTNPFRSYVTSEFKTTPELPAGCANVGGTICSRERSVQIVSQLVPGTTSGFTGMASGGTQSVVKAKMTCQHNDSAAVTTETRMFELGETRYYQADINKQTASLSCTKANGQIRDVVLDWVTREELCAYTACQDSWVPFKWRGGPSDEVYYKATGVQTDGKIRTTVVCRNSAGVETTITADSPTGAPSVTIPSCTARGLGEAVGISTDFVDGEIVRKNIFKGSGSPGSAGQKLEIRVDGVACQVGWQACESWAGLSVVAPERVKCFLGGAEVALSQCNYLEGAYLVGGTPATKTNIDGNPATWTDPATIPGWVPHKESAAGPTADPTITPSPQPEASPDPGIKPEPKPQPSPSPSPGTGTGTGTFPSSGTNPGGSTSKPGGKNCFGTSWSWNPVDWVVHPVSCALSWAFEPSKDVKTRLTTMQDQFSDRVPMTWFGVGQPIAGGSCPAHWELTYKGETYPFICGTTADGIVQTFRPILGAMLVIAAVFPLVRSLFYSSIPVMKVNPS